MFITFLYLEENRNLAEEEYPLYLFLPKKQRDLLNGWILPQLGHALYIYTNQASKNLLIHVLYIIEVQLIRHNKKQVLSILQRTVTRTVFAAL